MTPEELKAQLDELVKELPKIQALTKKNEEKETQIKELSLKVESLKEKGSNESEKIEELLNEISDLRTQIKAPVSSLNTDSKQALRFIAEKAFNTFIRDCRKSNTLNFDEFIKGDKIQDQIKELSLSDDGSNMAGTAADAVASILGLDLIEYARERSPILSLVKQKSGLTRDYSELVLSKYPTIEDGLEQVAGVSLAETGTQEYQKVKSDAVKLMANAPITDEAFFGSTYNVYSDLVRLLGDEIAIGFAYKILYGDGSDLNGRGILSSSRVDITATTGESWKPSMGVDARNPDYFPVHSTGVSGSLGADSEAIQDLMEDVASSLPTKYQSMAKWHMNRKTRSELAKVRDGMGRVIFKRSMIEGQVDMILGYPVVIDDTLPDLAADSFPVIFGSLSEAFAISNGDISYMQINPYKKQGVRYIEHNHEMFTIAQKTDALLIVAASATSAP